MHFLRVAWHAVFSKNGAYFAYFVSATSYDHKMFMKSSPGANVKKLFTAVSYASCLQARAVVPGEPFQPNPKFVVKSMSLPLPGTTALAYYEKA
jgi:hypothetical protein